MYILALDGSGLSLSVAVAGEDAVYAEYIVNNRKTHSQTLLPAVKEVLAMVGKSIKDMDYVAVTKGPGSFTGLRICASTAKGLCLYTNKSIVPVPTTECLAYNYEGSDKLICPIMDARRNQVYTALYSFENEGRGIERSRTGLVTHIDTAALDISDIISEINKYDREVIFLGDGVRPYEKIIRENIKVPYSFAPVQNNLQKASSLARAAVKRIDCAEVVSAMDFVPDYYRLSQAERERMEKGLDI